MELRIPFATLLKIALFILACAVVYRLRSLLLTVIVAVLIAVVLDPLEKRLARRVPRWAAMTVIGFLLLAGLATFFGYIVPETLVESGKLLDELPRIADRARRSWPAGSVYIDRLLSEARPPSARTVLHAGGTAVTAIASIIFTLVLAMYFIVDGRRLLAWLVTYAPMKQRRKILETLRDIRPLIFAYVRGTLITSTLSLIVALAVLVPLRVPAAFPLAVLAFAGNFVPVVGFIVALVPAALLASTISTGAALIVIAVYFTYQMIENYVISPRVFGRQMELSTVAVLLAFAAGAAVIGPIGAILILPFVAAWPAVEKIWFADRLPPDTIEKHDEIEENGVQRVDDVL